MEIIDHKYKIENIKLGTGKFSEVFLGLNIISNQQIAIKKISLLQEHLEIDKLKFEIMIMQKLDYLHVVGYYDVMMNDRYCYIIMEYCDAGTLNDVIQFNHITTSKSISFNREANTYYYLKQLSDAINYLKLKDFIFVHFNILPNILNNYKNI